MLTKFKQKIYTSVDENDIAFCYIYLKRFNPVLGREITYRVDFDLVDRPMVESLRWHMHDGGYVFSPITLNGFPTKSVYMHRQCAQEMLTLEKNVVDHIDFIRTNNRRHNLRATTLSENSSNKSLKCPFGLDYIQAIHVGKYEAYVPRKEDGRGSILLGVFSTREEAINAQKEYIKTSLSPLTN